MIPLLTPLIPGRALLYAGAAVAALAALAYVVNEHDNRVRAQQAVAAQAAQIATMTADHQREVAALEQTAASAARRAADSAAIRSAIHGAPTTAACAASPAIAAALGGLRQRHTAGGSGAARSAGQPHDLPAGAGAAGR